MVAAGFAEAGSQCRSRRQDVLTAAAVALPVGCPDRRAVTRLFRLPRRPRPLPNHPLRGEGQCLWRLHSSKATSQGTNQEYQWPSKELMPSRLIDVWYKIFNFPRSLRLATDDPLFPEISEFTPVSITADTAGLAAGEQEVLQLLIKAAQHLDPIFNRQEPTLEA